MYINPFFAGVFSTICVEALALIAYAIYSASKKK